MRITIVLFLLPFFSNAQTFLEETINYSYDDLNRLIHVSWQDGSERTYVYDDVGNRIQVNITGTLGIDDEVLKSTITVYPNPTDQFLNVQLPEGIIDSDTTIELYDISGRLIGKPEATISEQTMQMNVVGLSNGVYLIKVNNRDQQWAQLFIKK